MRSSGAVEPVGSASRNSPPPTEATSSPHTCAPAANAAAPRPNAEQARYYFGLEPQATPADIAAVVDYYPVFRVQYDT